MARDYTKYTVEGLGDNLNKRQLVFEIVKDWASKNNPSVDEIKKAFPDEVQGSKSGLIVKENEVKSQKNFNMKEPLTIKGKVSVVVSNQWGNNLPNFIKCAEELGYSISKTNANKPASSNKDLIDLKDFEIWKLAEFFGTKEGNQEDLDSIDEEIEALLDKSPKYYVVGKLFEKYDFEYHRDDVDEYFSLGEDESFDEDDLLDMLRDETLLSRIIKKENLTDVKLSPDNTDFVLLFSGYFIKALELLVYRDDNEMIAEFIVNQSVQTIEDEYNVDTLMGDWLGDITAELIENIYGYDIKDYDGECEIEAYYFGQNHSMGYDFYSYAQDIIDSLL
jgi:hypothetical protein